MVLTSWVTANYTDLSIFIRTQVVKESLGVLWVTHVPWIQASEWKLRKGTLLHVQSSGWTPTLLNKHKVVAKVSELICEKAVGMACSPPASCIRLKKGAPDNTESQQGVCLPRLVWAVDSPELSLRMIKRFRFRGPEHCWTAISGAAFSYPVWKIRGDRSQRTRESSTGKWADDEGEGWKSSTVDKKARELGRASDGGFSDWLRTSAGQNRLQGKHLLPCMTVRD